MASIRYCYSTYNYCQWMSLTLTVSCGVPCRDKYERRCNERTMRTGENRVQWSEKTEVNHMHVQYIGTVQGKTLISAYAFYKRFANYVIYISVTEKSMHSRHETKLQMLSPQI